MRGFRRQGFGGARSHLEVSSDEELASHLGQLVFNSLADGSFNGTMCREGDAKKSGAKAGLVVEGNTVITLEGLSPRALACDRQNKKLRWWHGESSAPELSVSGVGPAAGPL